MLISVKMAPPISIFYYQKMRYQYLNNYQKERKNARFNKRRKNQMLGPSGPLLCPQVLNGFIFLMINMF